MEYKEGFNTAPLEYYDWKQHFSVMSCKVIHPSPSGSSPTHVVKWKNDQQHSREEDYSCLYERESSDKQYSIYSILQVCTSLV